MPPQDRLSLLCDQTALTGIDFIQVVEPLVQTVLRVFFVVEPTAVDVPLVDGTLLGPVPPGQEIGSALAENGLAVEIVSVETGRSVAIDTLAWRRVRAPAGIRAALEIAVVEPGDFSIHRLTIDDARLDRFFNGTAFSFKQGCPSPFDCRTDCKPEPEPFADFPVDYLARDFFSFRRALLDFAAERYPQWSEPLEADQAVMLMEIMAALGDELAYTQDRYTREVALETATQRRSRSALARLVDYVPDPGNSAATELAIWVRAGVGGAQPARGARVWALPERQAPIPFSVRTPVWHHERWNEIPLHQSDGDVGCLPKGATDAYLVTSSPTAAELPPGTPLTPEAFWSGRRAILRSQPESPDQPERAFAITLVAVEHVLDELVLAAGAPTQLAHITWQEPLPFPMPLADTSALLNIVPMIAGEEVVERFRIGSDAALLARFPALTPPQRAAALALPRAVEREGPYAQDREQRGLTLRYGLRQSEERGLGWSGERDPLGLGTESAQEPLLSVVEVLPPALTPDPAADSWVFHRDLLEADVDTSAYTLEEGMWREVVTHRTPFEDVVFQDYAGDAGWTLRFGDGELGRSPAPGTLFEVRYALGPGSVANLPPDSVVHLEPPPGAPPGLLFGYASAATNPLLVTDGRDEETPASIRIHAPEAFRALPLRAVRPEDFRAIVERLDWVQRANATTRWTGSWSTELVVADPENGFELAPRERAELAHAIDCVRLAARDARAREPDYLDLDLEIDVCVRGDFYVGEVLPRIVQAVSAPGFFAPDNFTFGQPLHRSALEATVHGVPGVTGVEEIRVRVRRRRDWRVLSEPSLEVGPEQILRMQNDPRFPGRGSLRVMGHGGAE